MQGWLSQRAARPWSAVLALALLVAACVPADATPTVERSPEPTTTTAPGVQAAAASSTSAPTTAPPPSTTAPPPTTVAPTARAVVETGLGPFAAVGDIVLHHPATRVERIGFHQSNHEGAQQLGVLAGAARPVTLESRGRLAGDRTAADIVVDPTVAIHAPVTGTVVRAGGYTLYCDNVDEYVVIEPDGYPGWEAKILHIVGVSVAVGTRVEAGVTPIASHANVLPFASQVDELTAEPSWPHTHVELVDTAIPNVSSPGSGSEDC